MSHPAPGQEYFTEGFNLCVCGHDISDHNNADRCGKDDCTCKMFEEMEDDKQ